MEGSLHIFDSVIHWSCWFLDLTFSVVSLWTEWLTSASWCMHRTGVFLLGLCGWPLASLLIPIILISDQWSQNSPCLSLLQTPQYGTEKRKRDELESSYLIANRKKMGSKSDLAPYLLIRSWKSAKYLTWLCYHLKGSLWPTTDE